MEKPESQELNEVLSAIREMVQTEARASFEQTDDAASADDGPVEQTVAATPSTNVLILRPSMRVEPEKSNIFILRPSARVHVETPPVVQDDSFSVASPAIDEGMLRDMVREVVQEQLRGELGREIISALKDDMGALLEKNR